MIEKYGKSVADIKKAKQSFFDDNDKLVEEQARLAQFYQKQPVRKVCKNCYASLNAGNVCYESHGLKYMLCANCGHVQGLFEETEEYSQYIYSDSGYGSYMYASEGEQEKYDLRINNIYRPKLDFLMEVLADEGISRKDINLLDIGAGSGYFLSACDDCGIAARGVDISEAQVNYGKHFMHKKNGTELSLITGGHLETAVKSSKANVISAIGVLEHLVDYHSILEEARKNNYVKYLYIMVPMFGLSNVLETLLPDVYNRHLGGPHTHVFSQSSLKFLCKKYNMTMIGRWQFGTDMMDLYRMCIVKNNREFGTIVHEKLYKCLDDMQLVLDKNDFCSEIHAVFKLNEE